MELFSKVPEEIYFTVPNAYLKKKYQGEVLFHPSSNYYISEARYFGLNWLVLWALSCVLTKHFRDENCANFKNYFELKDAKGKPFKSQTWHDGVRAGVQLVAAHAKAKAVANLPGERILYFGTLDAIKNPAGLEHIADFDKVFGAGIGEAVQFVYNEVIAFAKDDGFETPPEDGDTLPPVPPPAPPVSEPIKPIPTDPNAPMPTWKKAVIWIVTTVTPLLFIVGFFLPGPWMVFIRAIVELLKKIVGL